MATITANRTRKLTKKQKAFVEAYKNTGDATRSVIDAGYNVKDNKSAAVIANENLNRLNIRQLLAVYSAPALQRIESISRESKNAMVQLLANKDILDRAGFKPVERTLTADISPLLVLPKEIIDNS